MNDTLIVNAKRINEGRRWQADLRIRTAPNLSARANEIATDASVCGQRLELDR